MSSHCSAHARPPPGPTSGPGRPCCRQVPSLHPKPHPAPPQEVHPPCPSQASTACPGADCQHDCHFPSARGCFPSAPVDTLRHTKARWGDHSSDRRAPRSQVGLSPAPCCGHHEHPILQMRGPAAPIWQDPLQPPSAAWAGRSYRPLPSPTARPGLLPGTGPPPASQTTLAPYEAAIKRTGPWPWGWQAHGSPSPAPHLAPSSLGE